LFFRWKKRTIKGQASDGAVQPGRFQLGGRRAGNASVLTGLFVVNPRSEHLNSRDPVVRPGIDVHQYYTLEVTATPSAALADIYSFNGVSGMGVPTKYTIQFTHPQRDLPRSDYVNRKATFVIQPPPAGRWSKPEAARRVYGVVTSMAQIASNHDQTMYEVTLESRLALLRNMPRTRFFLDTTEPEVIRQILEEHEFNQVFGDFDFDLYRTYRKRPIITQWCEDDLGFVMRLCRRVGIWFVCEPNGRCENVRFGDDFTKYIHDKARFTVPYLEPSGLHTTGQESVQSLTMRTTMVPAKFSVRSYSPEQQNNLCKDGTETIHSDPTVYGETYTWGLDLDDEKDAGREAQLRQEAALAEQIVYTGTCDMLDIAPSCVLELSNRELPEVKYGLLVTGMTCSASRKQGYKVGFTAIPSDRQYRMPLMEETWPRIAGVITGTIASTPGYVGPYLDDQGRYIVHLHVDRDPRTPGLESCPMRLAKPFAGPGNVGFHFGLEPKTVVGVAFLWNNPDFPFISHVLHTARHTDPIRSGHPWAQRNTIHTRSNNTIQLEDRQGQEHIKVATENGKSQLTLGHMVDRGQAERGSGTELRTDGAAAVRGGAGVMVSAYARNGASGKQLDMQETVAQLEDALAVAKALASSAQASKAEAADTDSQQAVNKSLDQLHGSSVLITTPGSTGVVTGKHTQFVADGNIAGVAKGDVSWSTWKRFTVAAHDMVSLFTQKGMKLVAATGDMIVQSQRGRMQLASQEDMSVESVNGVVHVKAAKEIILNVNGTYVKISGGGVEIGSRGGVLYRTAGVKGSGPAQMDLGGAAFSPQFVPYTTACEVWRTNPGFVPPLAPAPAPAFDAAQSQGVGNLRAVQPAPPAAASGMPLAGAQNATTTNTGTNSSSSNGSFLSRLFDRSTIHINDPGNAPGDIRLPANSDGKDGNNYVTEPIQLANPAPCNWTMPTFNREYDQNMETVAYYPWTDEQTRYIPNSGDPWRISGGKGHATFDVKYDDATKTLTAFVKIGVILKDIYEVDPVSNEFLKLPTGTNKSVPYDSVKNGENAPSSAKVNLRFVDRETTTFNFSEKENFIKNTLNQNSYRLILDRCSKGAACGCRIAIKFDVKFVVLRSSDENVPGYGRIIKLYPYAARDDSRNWGEIGASFDPTARDYDFFGTDYTPAHECGHLFNYPDEYYSDGGAVHEQYIDNEQLQFAKGHALAGTTTWQMISQGNLMGLGARNKMADGAKPAIPPYYMEYLRRWMTKHTNKKWRVGVNNACWRGDVSPS
jgi:Rhs element Vgr protein